MRAQRRTRIHTKFPALALASLVLLATSACEGSRDDPAQGNMAEMAWAREALVRNPNLDVVAADPVAGVFTVRDRRTGEVQVVKLSDLAAAPTAQLSVQPAPASAGGSAWSAPATEPMAADEPVASETATDDAADPLAAQADASATDTLKYTIERTGSSVKVSGPGVAIVSAGSAPGATTAKGEAGQRTVEPIVCEGQRMMHLDNRQIFVDGDAITALKGCELFITNSRVVASGIGVVVRDSVVHITNSYIEGASGSYDAGIGARLFIQGATFKGIMHRDAFAKITEQDGNPSP